MVLLRLEYYILSLWQKFDKHYLKFKEFSGEFSNFIRTSLTRLLGITTDSLGILDELRGFSDSWVIMFFCFSIKYWNLKQWSLKIIFIDKITLILRTYSAGNFCTASTSLSLKSKFEIMLTPLSYFFIFLGPIHWIIILFIIIIVILKICHSLSKIWAYRLW